LQPIERLSFRVRPSRKENAMEGQQTSVVHWYDPVDRRVACGMAGFGRSTKHVRTVTCPSCVELVRNAVATDGRREEADHVTEGALAARG
jgi:hypothetical protein